MKTKGLSILLGGLLVLGAAGCGGGGEASEDGIESVRSALTTTIQAEQAFDIEEGVIESIHAGFTGTGYVNIDNDASTFIWFIHNSPAAGSATVRIRYANGTGTNRPIRVSANGGPAVTVNGNPTGAWTTWANVTTGSVTLAAGNNDVILSSVTADGMPNIDRIEIIQSFTQTFQAEQAANIEEGVIESQHAGFTGTGYVNIDNVAGTFIFFVINSPATAPVSLRVRYANGAGANRPIHLTVNGTSPGTLTGGPTGAWTTWVTGTLPANLVAGSNDVVLSSVSADGMPNIDRIEITW